MKIGIDIDGVLTDIEQWQLDYGSKFYYENYGLEIKNYKGYETNEIFDVDIKLDDEFWNKYFREYSINVEARKFANEVIYKLKDSITGKSHHNCVFCPKTAPIFLLFSILFSFGTIPFTTTCPDVGDNRPVSIFIVVDFPAPFSPM